MWRVVLARKAEKSLRKLPRSTQRRILVALVGLRTNPYAGKKLTGDLRGQYSLRVWPYRILYEIKRTKLIVTVVYIGHRQGAYH
jgi:mRNA interferase RelE/StbE